MALKSFQIREAFHLLALRAISQRLASRSYALKGGVCLRFYHQSPRLSEDMDLDVMGIPSKTLARNMEMIFKSQALQAFAKVLGITAITISASKQTEITQRWKFALNTEGGASLQTKIEFSKRRNEPIRSRSGSPSGHLLTEYRLPTFVAKYYGPWEMALQKVDALASPSRQAARDLFDLHHLVQREMVTAQELAEIPGKKRMELTEKIQGFAFKSFLEEVIPFLPSDLAEAYSTKEWFEQMVKELTESFVHG